MAILKIASAVATSEDDMTDYLTLPKTVNVAVTERRVRTDARVALLILIMLQDPDLTPADKTEALLRMFYPDEVPPEQREEAVKACLKFLQPQAGGKGRPGLVDWEHDLPLMIAPVNHILGTEIRAEAVHWHSFLSAYLEIGPDTLYARVLTLREKTRSGQKLTKEERTWVRRNRHLIDPPKKLSAAEQKILEKWT